MPSRTMQQEPGQFEGKLVGVLVGQGQGDADRYGRNGLAGLAMEAAFGAVVIRRCRRGLPRLAVAEQAFLPDHLAAAHDGEEGLPVVFPDGAGRGELRVGVELLYEAALQGSASWIGLRALMADSL